MMASATVNPSSAAAGEVPESSESLWVQDAAEVEGFQHLAEDLIARTDKLEKKVNEIVDFFHCKRHGSSAVAIAGLKRSPDLMRQFSAILKQITDDKMAAPFREPVDVKGLGLYDYYEIIKKPMDFSTILKKMEINNESGYQSVREICSDVKLIFLNAMEYNAPSHQVHQMAKSLLDKFELKCRHLMPKIIDEEARQKEDQALFASNAKMSPEAAMARLAWETDTELNNVYILLGELREKVIQKCRKMSTKEKRKLSSALCELAPDELNKALEIVAKDNPDFHTSAEELDLDMDAQSETTLWRLKFFVKESLEREAKKNANGNAKAVDPVAKRKRDISEAIANSNKMKKSKKQP